MSRSFSARKGKDFLLENAKSVCDGKPNYLKIVEESSFSNFALVVLLIFPLIISLFIINRNKKCAKYG